MSYKLGTMFHGTNKYVGNIWIVYQDNSNDVALLLDGRLKLYCQDLATTKKDKLSPMSLAVEVTPTELHSIAFVHGPLPQWAQDLCNGRANTMFNALPIPTVTLSPGVIQKIQKSLDIDLTKDSEKVILRKDEDHCPSGSWHQYVNYTGLNQSFQYCTWCDAKRAMPKDAI